ncbi:MAG: hypothetical protein AB7T59_00575 [Hyphomonadaceae bacterium]
MRKILAALAVLSLAAPAAAQQQQAPTCDAPAFRAFDFWIGEWDAFRADTNAPAGRSSIRAEDAGCVITEHWVSLGQSGYSGRSLNIYDRGSEKWEQFWVDSTGNRVHFIGGPTENGMRVATAAPVWVSPSQQAYSRITFTANPDGTVLQHGEQSADGQTWTTSYAFIYRRRAE